MNNTINEIIQKNKKFLNLLKLNKNVKYNIFK